MRSASSALVALPLVLALGACGGSVAAPAPTNDPVRAVSFTEVATAQNSKYDGNATVIVGSTDAAIASITALVPQASAVAGRALVAAFQGGQRTGGYAMRIDAIERDGDRLVVHATFTSPAPGSIVTQVLTSPVQVVSIAQADAAGARQAVLLDGSGTERARTALP